MYNIGMAHGVVLEEDNALLPGPQRQRPCLRVVHRLRPPRLVLLLRRCVQHAELDLRVIDPPRRAINISLSNGTHLQSRPKSAKPIQVNSGTMFRNGIYNRTCIAL